jgi:hypothetical protein
MTWNMTLDSYRWKNRPLVLFADSDSSAALREQRARIRAADRELEDRDMLIIEIAGAPSHELRQRFSVDVGTEVAVLVGKDGGEKHRCTLPCELGRIFELVDAMPMRRREMAEGR